MNKENMIIRVATVDDASEILSIYAPYVDKTVISFEYEVPTLDEFKERIRKTLTKYPYIVAESEGEILGYAYTGAFVGRAAYDWSVETTIYLKDGKQKMGLGRKLYRVLEEISKAQNFLNMNACIGYPEVEDEYLTKNSVQFHAHLGFNVVGEFHQSGYKFGRWYNMVWMEKMIGVHGTNPSPIIQFKDLNTKILDTILEQ